MHGCLAIIACQNLNQMMAGMLLARGKRLQPMVISYQLDPDVRHHTQAKPTPLYVTESMDPLAATDGPAVQRILHVL